MKLRNLMYATMIACAFASCSKDEVVEPGNGPEAGTGDFTITVLTNGGKVTKANQTIPDELSINDFTVNVYSVSGTEDAPVYTWVKSQSLTTDFISKTESSDGYSKMTIENLPLNQTYVCYGYANLGDAAPQGTGTAYGATAVVKIPDAGFIATDLPMVGTSEAKVLAATGTEYTIALDRVVSRVDIVGLTLDANAGKFGASEVTFKLTGISINGVTTSVNSNNTAVAGDPAYWGWFAADNVWHNTVGGKDFFQDPFVGNTITSKSSEETASAKTITWGETPASATVSTPAASYYILPNPSKTKVQVALQGLFSYVKDGQSTTALPSTYPVVVAEDGMDTSDNGVVTNNKLYRISITVAGPGSYGKGSMLVNATVTDYELKTQSVVVE